MVSSRYVVPQKKIGRSKQKPISEDNEEGEEEISKKKKEQFIAETFHDLDQIPGFFKALLAVENVNTSNFTMESSDKSTLKGLVTLTWATIDKSKMCIGEKKMANQFGFELVRKRLKD